MLYPLGVFDCKASLYKALFSSVFTAKLGSLRPLSSTCVSNFIAVCFAYVGYEDGELVGEVVGILEGS